MRRYAIRSLFNMRDLGGYPTQEGGFTQYGKMIRSDCPTEFHEQDFKQIHKLQITQVIDLRTEEECSKRPSAYTQIPGVKYDLCTFKTGDLAPETEADIPRGYLAMFDDHENVKRVFELLAQNEGTTLFHCAVGKDRTGIISAILLGICKVPMADILADYQVSYTYLKPLVEQIRQNNPDWPQWMGQSNSEYMAGALELLFEKYGCFEAYLEKAGVNDSDIRRLQNKFMAQSEV